MSIKHIIERYTHKINDLPTFLNKLSDLMQEGYKLSEGLIMLLPYYTKHTEKWETIINESLQNGLNASEIFEKLKVDKEFLIALHFADRHGDLVKTLHHIGEQMRYKEKMKAQLLKIIAYPLFMFILLVAFFLGFRMYFLPNIAQLISSRAEEDTKAIWWSKLLLHMPDYFLLLLLSILLAMLFFISSFKRKAISSQIKLFMKIPIVRYFYRLQVTRQFARNLGNLLLSGFSLQQALNELKQQNIKKDIQYIAGEIEGRVLYGESLTSCIRLFPFFSPKFDLFVSHGENSGLLGRELILYCDMLDEKMKQSLSTVFSFIQPVLFVIIAICIVAAYLSILLPMYKMIDII